MKLESLPEELLLQILAGLKRWELECVAQTYNKKLARICLPLLWPDVAQFRGNLSAIPRAIPDYKAHLGNMPHTSHTAHTGYALDKADWYYDLLFDPTTTIGPKIKNDLDFLQMNGSFDWLEDAEGTSSWDLQAVRIHQLRFGIASPDQTNPAQIKYLPPWTEDTTHQIFEPASPERIHMLQARAKKLGITLPNSFFRFVTDKALRDKMPMKYRLYGLGKRFYRRNVFETDDDGYLIFFAWEYSHIGSLNIYYLLYLDREGRESIVTLMRTQEMTYPPPEEGYMEPAHMDSDFYYDGRDRCFYSSPHPERNALEDDDTGLNTGEVGNESCDVGKCANDYCQTAMITTPFFSPDHGFSEKRNVTFEEFIAQEYITQWKSYAFPQWILLNHCRIPDVVWRQMLYQKTGCGVHPIVKQPMPLGDLLPNVKLENWRLLFLINSLLQALRRRIVDLRAHLIRQGAKDEALQLPRMIDAIRAEGKVSLWYGDPRVLNPKFKPLWGTHYLY